MTVYCIDPKAERHMLELVRRMHYDQALTTRGWRLEYRLPESGFPHYLLVRSGKPVALQYIRAQHWLDEVQVKLSRYLVMIGFRGYSTWRNQPTVIPLNFEHNRLPWMFAYEGWSRMDGEINEEELEDFSG